MFCDVLQYSAVNSEHLHPMGIFSDRKKNGAQQLKSDVTVITSRQLATHRTNLPDFANTAMLLLPSTYSME